MTDSSETKNCPYCAEKILVAAVYCRFCHHDLLNNDDKNIVAIPGSNRQTQLAAPGSLANPSSEVTYLENSDVTVTNLRILISGKTYALSNVTSVGVTTIPQNHSGAITFGCTGTVFGLLILGVNAILGSDGGKFFGILVTVLSIFIPIQLSQSKKDKYYVVIRGSSGEFNALWAYDKDYIESIAKSINDAIVKRG
ncbi:DUF6232 family protein [Armatimonas sp.]|uniref:DUF6232 family protein n=1 Tax=Armatimonas sp. TaxID=1872638 RepID=UPI00286A7502|nr:DUF6232 family protein [Armatimonas sp.]